MASSLVDIYVLYRIIKDLSTPFEETDAYKLDLIDNKGKRLRTKKGVKVKASNRKEKEADNYYFRFIRNLKRMMDKVGLGSKIATFAAALFLIREQYKPIHILTEDSFKDEDGVFADLVFNIKYLEKNSMKNYTQFQEEIANVTGAAVAGTGSDPVHWKRHPFRIGEKGDRKRKGRYINGIAYLKRIAKEKAKKEELENGFSKA